MIVSSMPIMSAGVITNSPYLSLIVSGGKCLQLLTSCGDQVVVYTGCSTFRPVCQGVQWNHAEMNQDTHLWIPGRAARI